MHHTVDLIIKKLRLITIEYLKSRAVARGNYQDSPQTEKIVVENGVIFQSCIKWQHSRKEAKMWQKCVKNQFSIAILWKSFDFPSEFLINSLASRRFSSHKRPINTNILIVNIFGKSWTKNSRKFPILGENGKFLIKN